MGPSDVKVAESDASNGRISWGAVGWIGLREQLQAGWRGPPQITASCNSLLATVEPLNSSLPGLPHRYGLLQRHASMNSAEEVKRRRGDPDGRHTRDCQNRVQEWCRAEDLLREEADPRYGKMLAGKEELARVNEGAAKKDATGAKGFIQLMSKGCLQRKRVDERCSATER